MCGGLEGARAHARVFVPVLCFKRTVLSGRHHGAQALFTSQGNCIKGLWCQEQFPPCCLQSVILWLSFSLRWACLLSSLFLMILRAPGLQRWLWLLHHGDPVPGTEPITWNGCSRKHSRTKAWRLLWFLAIYLPRQLYSHNSTSAETFFHIFNTCMKFHLIVNYFKQLSIFLKVNKIKIFLNVLPFVKEIGCFVETL